MENESRFSILIRNFSDKIQDQVWFQQIKVKWDELDSRTRMSLKYGSLIGFGVLMIGLVATSLIGVAGKKKDIDDRLALVSKIQSAQDELRRLKDVTSRFNSGGEQPWGEFLQSKTQTAGIDGASLKIVSEKILDNSTPSKDFKDFKSKDSKAAATPPSTGPEETLLETSITHINVRQLVKFVHEVENGGRTVKVRRLQVDTSPDASGYLNATLIVSAFKFKQ